MFHTLSSKLYFSVLIENGADVNAVDSIQFTPLHYAAKWGCERNITLLLDNDANPDAKGHRLQTPLHVARRPNVVKMLVKNGCNQYLKMIGENQVKRGEKCAGKECKCNSPEEKDSMKKGADSVFSTLLYRNDKCAEVVLNQHVRTNEEEHDSSDLLIVYDLQVFKNEADDPKNEEKYGSQKDEMAGHSKIVDLKSKILMHPISEVMLSLKWTCMSKYFWSTVVQYFLFVLLLTGLATYQKFLLSKNSTQLKNEAKNPICLNNKAAHQCSFAEIHNDHWFYVLYVLVLLNSVWLFFREFSQMYYNWYHYIRSWEDKMEALLIVFTILYLVGVFVFPVSILKHFTAWAVFLAWMELALLLGRFPGIGIYVHMFTKVSKVLVLYVIVYAPVILGFSFVFYILLSNKDTFMNPPNAIIKTFVMLIGELEYEENFLLQMSGDGKFSTQLVLVVFLLLGCIVIMNLLVGLAVSEIDKLRKQANEIRLKLRVEELIRQEDLFVKKPSLLDWLSTSWQTRIVHHHSLFSRLRIETSNRKMSLCQTIGNLSEMVPLICVRPIMPKVKKVKPRGRKESLQHVVNQAQATTRGDSSTNYPVYFYNEEKRRLGDATGFYLPKYLVLDTLEWVMANDVHGTIDHITSAKLNSPTSTYPDANNQYENEDVMSNAKTLFKIRNKKISINKILEALTITSNSEPGPDFGNEEYENEN